MRHVRDGAGAPGPAAPDSLILRVTITIGPTDLNKLELFRWVLGWVVRLHAESPAPLRVRVERVEDG